MTHDQQTPSTTEQHAEARSSRSRRGFLKKTAAAGILGMTGMAVATETASARNVAENAIRVYGQGSSGGRYYIRTSGDIDPHPKLDGHDDIDAEPDDVEGRVAPGGQDVFFYNEEILEIDVVGNLVIYPFYEDT